MADKEIQVHKEIVWRLKHMTKEKIEAFDFDETLESPSLKIVFGGNVTEWSFCLYPGRDDEKKKGSVALFLLLKEADSRSFKTKFTLGIIGKKGNVEYHTECPAEAFKRGYGTKALLKRSDLLNPDLGYLDDGKLWLYCKLTITAKEAPKSGKKALLNQNQVDKFKRMFDEEIFTDFGIVTSDDKVLKAHKCILAVGSPFFFGMLNTNMKENKENVVKVPEDSVIMKEVLRSIYGNQVENLSAIACELVFAAEKYQLAGLKEMCIDTIIEMLEPKNVLQTLNASTRLTKSDKLKDNCVEMIVNNFQFVSDSEDWQKLPPSLVSEIKRRTIAEDKGTIYV